MGVGCPEYILLFRKLPTDRSTAYADEPVKKDKADYSLAQWQLDAHAFWRSSGNRLLHGDELKALTQGNVQRQFKDFCNSVVYDYRGHVDFSKELEKNNQLGKDYMTVPPSAGGCGDVWDDVNRMDTLNKDQRRKDLQLHVCPLQLDIVERIINRYSNPGDLVLDPFGGLGTVALVAMRLGRRGYTIELNPDYFRDAVNYLESEEAKIGQPTLFDLVAGGEGA